MLICIQTEATVRSVPIFIQAEAAVSNVLICIQTEDTVSRVLIFIQSEATVRSVLIFIEKESTVSVEVNLGCVLVQQRTNFLGVTDTVRSMHCILRDRIGGNPTDFMWCQPVQLFEDKQSGTSGCM